MHGHHVEDELCVCFHVGRAKIIRYVRRERPRVVSMVSQCLSAGTGCGWCIPFLQRIHEDVMAGREPEPMMSREEYLRRRAEYHKRLKSIGAVIDGDAAPRGARPSVPVQGAGDAGGGAGSGAPEPPPAGAGGGPESS